MINRSERTIWILAHQRCHARVKSAVDERRRSVCREPVPSSTTDFCRPEPQSLRILARSSLAYLIDQLRPDPKVDEHLLSCLHFLSQVAAPSLEVIHPCLNGEFPGPEIHDHKAGTPGIVAQLFQRDFFPIGVLAVAIAEDRAEYVVAVGKNIRGHHDAVTYDALHRKAFAIDLRLDALDHHARRRALRHRFRG